MAFTSSQRIVLITEIAKRLAGEEWPLIDLTLKQFGLPWTNSWTGSDKKAYSIAMLEDAPDSKLAELAQHVGFDFAAPKNSQIEPAFWEKGKFRIFITHLATHKAFSGKLKEELTPLGISSFVAHNDIEPTTEWQTQIETALATADALVALLHPDFHLSNWTDQEIGFAMGRGIPVFSVRFGQDPYGFIGRFQAFNGANKEVKGLAIELFDAYRKHKQTKGHMAEVLVRLFEQSNSFAAAKLYIGYLEELDVWDPSFTARINKAVEENPQISDSWGVPQRVAALAAAQSAVS